MEMASVRDEVEVRLHEHRFLVSKLLESLTAAAMYVGVDVETVW